MTGAADMVLLVHVLFVAFLVAGQVLIVTGGVRGWLWVGNAWFRLSHLVGIAIVVIQAWLGVICPLTSLEMALRERGGGAAYDGAFIAHWLQAILYYDAPSWVFVVCYTGFAVLVAASWFFVPPRGFGEGGRKD